MLMIRKEQRELLLRDLRKRHINELAYRIEHELNAQAADILKNYEKEDINSIILDVINNCHIRDITDEDQILNICYIRFNTNADVFLMDSFSYILENPLMHPYAKARHLILSFFAISAMKKGV